MDGYIVRSGSVPGFGHKHKQINNQDSLLVSEAVINGKTFSFGAVFDGCTGGKDAKHSRTEVGAALLAEFFSSEIPLILASHTPLTELPAILYQRSIGYFGSIARTTVMGSPETMWQFVQRYLLCTVLGYVTDGIELVVFSAGDGVIFVNDDVSSIDQNDKPIYFAYHLLDKRIIGHVPLPSSFETVTFPLNTIERFALSTDGIKKRALLDPAFIAGIWEYELGARAGLQWHLNKGANDSLFEDDCTVIGLHRNQTQ